MKAAHAIASCLLLAGCQLLGPDADAVRSLLARSYPNVSVQDARPSPIKGLVEIYSEGRIVYYAPHEDVLLVGDLLDHEGASISRVRYAGWLGVRASSIDLHSAFAIGEGDTDLIAFVDPDCAHCRQAIAWLEKQNYSGLRAHFFFLPMSPQSDAYGRALQVACAPDALRREALRQAFGVSASAGPSLRCTDGEQRLAEQAEIVHSVGVFETPVFVTKGETVRGFFPDHLAALLYPNRTYAGVSP